MIQYGEEEEPDYRHASIDIFLDPAVHGRGLGRDAVATLARYLVHHRRHHRLVIDPAADNERAIHCYSAVGFQPVGIMRRYERDADGHGWHDGLLMDLLADELRDVSHQGSVAGGAAAPGTQRSPTVGPGRTASNERRPSRAAVRWFHVAMWRRRGSRWRRGRIGRPLLSPRGVDCDFAVRG